MVTASSRPACSTVRHCGQRLPWSMAREKQGLQKEWPQGVVTAGGHKGDRGGGAKGGEAGADGGPGRGLGRARRRAAGGKAGRAADAPAGRQQGNAGGRAECVAATPFGGRPDWGREHAPSTAAGQDRPDACLRTRLKHQPHAEHTLGVIAVPQCPAERSGRRAGGWGRRWERAPPARVDGAGR